MATTSQGFLSLNMFAYCRNNPASRSDPSGRRDESSTDEYADGERFVGFGIQFEGQIGGISFGAEVIIYTDPIVCGDKEYLVAMYYYSGYEVSLTELGLNDTAIIALVNAVGTSAISSEFDSVDFSADMVLSIIESTLFDLEIGASAGVLVIWGNSDFAAPKDYSGTFSTLSISAKIKGVAVSGFLSRSDTCTSYGLKLGVSTGILKPFSICYSQTDYSNPVIM